MHENAESEFEALPGLIRQLAAEAGSFIVPNVPDTNEFLAVLRVGINATTALTLVKNVRPRLIYLSEVQFDPDSQISEALSQFEESDSKDLNSQEQNPQPLDKRLISLKSHWREHQDQLCGIVLAFMIDGVMHMCVNSTSWSDEFDKALDDVVTEIVEESAAKKTLLDERDDAVIRENAKILAAHHAFNSGRPSFAKRVFLAEKLFPGVNEDVLDRITERAEKLDWLKRAGES
jgi:hypothetical protein